MRRNEPKTVLGIYCIEHCHCLHFCSSTTHTRLRFAWTGGQNKNKRQVHRVLLETCVCLKSFMCMPTPAEERDNERKEKLSPPSCWLAVGCDADECGCGCGVSECVWAWGWCMRAMQQQLVRPEILSMRFFLSFHISREKKIEHNRISRRDPYPTKTNILKWHKHSSHLGQCIFGRVSLGGLKL